MSTQVNVIQNDNQLTVNSVYNTITVIDNNREGYIVEVIQPISNVITVTTGPAGNRGPVGPAGPTGSSIPFSNKGGDVWFTTSSIEITGSLTISGSNTFKNIGTGIFSGSVFISGSTIITGSTQGNFTGSLQGTSSYANQALTASYALNVIDTTFPYTGSAEIIGSLRVTGSTIISGSAIVTGSLNITGSALVNGNLGTTRDISVGGWLYASKIYPYISTQDFYIETNTNKYIYFRPGGIESVRFSNNGASITGSLTTSGSLIITGSISTLGNLFFSGSGYTLTIIGSSSFSGSIEILVPTSSVNLTPYFTLFTPYNGNSSIFKISSAGGGTAGDVQIGNSAGSHQFRVIGNTGTQIILDAGYGGLDNDTYLNFYRNFSTRWAIGKTSTNTFVIRNAATGSTIMSVNYTTGLTTFLSGSTVTGSLTVHSSGSFTLPTTASFITPQTGSMFFSGSYIWVHNGVRWMSASLA